MLMYRKIIAEVVNRRGFVASFLPKMFQDSAVRCRPVPLIVVVFGFGLYTTIYALPEHIYIYIYIYYLPLM